MENVGPRDTSADEEGLSQGWPSSTFFFFFFLTDLFNWRLITLQYCSGVCHTLEANYFTIL